MSDLEILITYGFEKAGEWRLLKGKIDPDLSPELAKKKNVVYAFVVADEVKYIGICHAERTKLEDRMRTQRTNKCMPCLIKKEINEGKKVKIFALKPGEVEYHGLKVNLVRSIEPRLIEIFNNPEWNIKTAKWRREQKPSS